MAVISPVKNYNIHVCIQISNKDTIKWLLKYTYEDKYLKMK